MKDKLWVLSIRLKNLLDREDGQDLIEYALIASVVALAAVVGMGTLANGINTAFGNIATRLNSYTG